jgi:hypothetical protein
MARAWGACLSAFLVALVGLAGLATEAESATSCVGKQLSSSQNLAEVAAGAPAGTTFCLQQGTYNVSTPVKIQSHDRFVGVYASFPRPSVNTNTAQKVFDANGSYGATIEGLRVEGAVADKSCQPFCGRGISGGTNLTVVDVRATENDNQGIGGTRDGLLVRDSELDNNGFGDNGAYYAQDGRESAAGLKSVNSMKVVNTYVHDNAWTGVWCDLECGRFEVQGSTLIGNGRAAIHDEVSTEPAQFVNNRIQDNGHAPYVWGRYGGLLIVSSQNVEAYGNTFGNNRRYGVEIHEDSRNPVVNNVSVHDNLLSGDILAGCGLSGVGCITNN